jgi:hypothetical protein
MHGPSCAWRQIRTAAWRPARSLGSRTLKDRAIARRCTRNRSRCRIDRTWPCLRHDHTAHWRCGWCRRCRSFGYRGRGGSCALLDHRCNRFSLRRRSCGHLWCGWRNNGRGGLRSNYRRLLHGNTCGTLLCGRGRSGRRHDGHRRTSDHRAGRQPARDRRCRGRSNDVCSLTCQRHDPARTLRND